MNDTPPKKSEIIGGLEILRSPFYRSSIGLNIPSIESLWNAAGFWPALQRNGTIWNLKPPGTPEGLLEQSRRLNLERALAQAKARESVDGS